MGTSIRRTTIWLVLAALSLAAAAWMAAGSAALGSNAGAPPNDDTGELKIVKNLGGGWPDGAFIFTWSCDDGQSGSAVFPDGFTGANFISPQEYPIGTDCTVEETDGVLSVDDYNVLTHTESRAGFQPINPRVVAINNSAGHNTIQYKNELKDPRELLIRKNVIAPLNGNPHVFTFEVSCDMGNFTDTVLVAGDSDERVDVPASTEQCKVTETKVDGEPLDDWTTTPDVEIFKILVDGENLFEFTNTYIERPEGSPIRIVKDQIGGPDDTPFNFTIECSDDGDDQAFPGAQISGDGELDVIIPFGFDQCTVTEVFDNGDGAEWATTVNQAGIPGRELTLELNPEGLTTFLFQNTHRPQPKDATIWVNKKFSGPEAWKFGFAFICQGYGNADTFVLGGGDSASFDIPFLIPSGTLADENVQGQPRGRLCVVAEELLGGDWTVNISVTGTSDYDTTPPDITGAVFAVYPGDAVTVTFENIAGYLAPGPSGIPPEIFPNDPR